MREWFTAQELKGLPGLPSTSFRIRERAKSEDWQKRKRAKGKGFEYHINSLPTQTRAALGHFGEALSIAAENAPSSWLVRWFARLLRPVVIEIIRREIRDA